MVAASRAQLALCLLLFLAIDLWAACASRQGLYAVFVSIPLLDHLLPLRRIASHAHQTLGIRVAVASCSSVAEWGGSGSNGDGVEFLRIPGCDSRSGSTWPSWSPAMDPYQAYSDHLEAMSGAYQRAMFNGLLNTLQADMPDVLVVDRFTFGGFDVAERLQLPVVVNSATLLLAIDSPPLHVAAPLLETQTASMTVVDRCLNPWYQLRFEIARRKGLRAINAARVDANLPPVASMSHLFRGSLVLSDSCFGLDQARHMRPLIRMVGSILPGEEDVTPERPIVEWLDSSSKPVLFAVAPRRRRKAYVKLLRKVARAKGMRLLVELGPHAPSSAASSSKRMLATRLVERMSVLRDSRVHAAVLQCSLTQAGDAIAATLPVVCSPTSPVQQQVAVRLEQLGAVAAQVAAHITDVETWTAAVDTALHLPQITANVSKARLLLGSFGGVTAAVEAVSEVAELGVERLLPRDDRMPWYQLMVLDVYAVYGFVLVAVAVILRTTWSMSHAAWRKLHRKMRKAE